MAGRPETPFAQSTVDERWLWGVRVATVVCMMLAVGAFALLWLLEDDWLIVELLVLPFLAGPYYLVIVLCLVRVQTQKTGLALAMGAGAVGFMFGALHLAVAAKEIQHPGWVAVTEMRHAGWLLAGYFALFVLAQASLVTTGVKCYSRRKREAGDWGRWVGGFVAAVAVFGFVLVSPQLAFDVYKRQRSNQVSTLFALRTLHKALEIYRAKCAGFPETFAPLAPPPTGEEANCEQLGSIVDAAKTEGHPTFEAVVRDLLSTTAPQNLSGYHFSYQAAEPIAVTQQSRPLYLHYVIRADPLERRKTGFYSFWLSDEGTIRHNRQERAGPNDPAWEQ